MSCAYRINPSVEGTGTTRQRNTIYGVCETICSRKSVEENLSSFDIRRRDSVFGIGYLKSFYGYFFFNDPLAFVKIRGFEHDVYFVRAVRSVHIRKRDREFRGERDAHIGCRFLRNELRLRSVD